LEQFRIMAITAIPLQDLAQRIRQQQAELEKLRKEYDARQAQMRELTRRKEELQHQLRQVEAEFQGLDVGSARSSEPARAAKRGKKPASAVSLSQLLVQILTKVARPLTTKELAGEVVRRKYSSKSRNLSALIDSRVYELVKKGVLHRSLDQPGVVSAQALAKPKAMAAGAKAATAIPPTVSGSDLSLPAIVVQILAKSSHPMAARDLAKKVLASGYQTKSKNFTDVIWAGVGKMNDVENVPGKGYRLRKEKSVTTARKIKGLK
jgi:DNA-binding protein H-NS